MKIEVPKEQVVYGKILYYGSIISIVAITAAFIAYVSGIMPHYVDFEKMAELWGKSHHVFVEEAKVPIGWGWVELINYADYLNLLLLAILAFLTIICYIAILPVFATKKDWIYATITLIEIIVLLFAASGFITTGH
ncbi:MAG: hypothetical protein ACK401_02240 [Archaeoglobaceae archaeon]